MESNFKKFIPSVNGGRTVNSTNKLGQNRRQFTPTRSMPPDTVQLSQAQGGLEENVRLTKKKLGFARNYKNRNTIAAFDGSKVISADTIGNLAKKEFKDSNKFTRKFILQFLHTKLDKCQNDDNKLTNLILSIKNTVTTQGKLAATTNDDIKLALTFLNKILEGAEKHNETISEKMMDTLNAFREVGGISEETKNGIETLEQTVRPKQTEIAPNTGDNSSNNVSKIVTHDLPSSDKTTISNRIDELGDIAQDINIDGVNSFEELYQIALNTEDENVISKVLDKIGDIAQNSVYDNDVKNAMIQLVNIALNTEAREQVINKLGDIVQNTTLFVLPYAFLALRLIALNTEAGEQVINKIGDIAQNSEVDTNICKIAIQQLGVLAQNPKTGSLAIQKLIGISCQAKNKDIKKIAITQFRVIAQNPKVDPNTRNLAINGLGVSALDPENTEQAIQELGVLAQNPLTTKQAIQELVVLAQNRETSDLAINKLGDIAQNTKDETVLSNAINGLGDIAQNSGDENVINNVMTQLVNIARNPKAREQVINKLGDIAQKTNVDKVHSYAFFTLRMIAQNPETSEQVINKLGDLAQNPKTSELAIKKLVVLAQNPLTTKQAIHQLGVLAQDPLTTEQAIQELVVLAQNPEAREQVINKLGDIAQDPKVDQETRNSAINGLGDIAKNTKTSSAQAINKFGFLDQNTETRELVMDEFRVLAQNPLTTKQAIHQLGVLAQNADQKISKSAIMQFTFIVTSNIVQKTEDNETVLINAINKLGAIAQDPTVDQGTRDFAIRQLGVCARNSKTSKQVINRLGDIAQDPTVDHETRNSAINKLGDIAQDLKVDQEARNSAINKLGAIAQDPTVDQKTKDFVIRQLGMIAKSNDMYSQKIALQKLSEIAQRDIFTLKKKTTTIKSVVSTLNDVAQMYPYSVKNVLKLLTQNIKDGKTAQNIKDNETVSELLKFINSAIKYIDKKYPNAEETESKNIEENNKKKAYFSQNS